jgi:4-hydroxy-3-methylbut-2-enyl diphosphate reductase
VVKRVLLASPRGYCAGVERAVETVERALALYGSPVYVRKQIVHNSHVVRDLEARGAVFVDELTSVPDGATVVFSAHGIAPSVRTEATERGLETIDATCPLVTKVHTQARRYADAGYAIVLIGHAGHEEVEGTLGEAPDAIVLVQSTEEAEHVALPDDRPLAYITQTTLSVDETTEIVAVLRRRFPQIEDLEPPVGREGAARGGRPAPRHRLAQLVQLLASRRRRACAWDRCLPRG